MKELLVKILVFVLRKLKCSVIIGYEVKGDIKPLNKMHIMCDNILKGKNFNSRGEEFNVPEGEYRIVT